jgi:hypothetical protein
MTSRTRPMTASEVRARASHAREYLQVARAIRDDVALSARNNLAASNAVLAGIAAADAICGHVLGRRNAGEDHAAASELLRQATPPTSRAATNLTRLTASKTDSQYSPNLIGASKAAQLMTAAERLVDEMEAILRR